ncbi:hypothetical protein EV702DRAFT_1049477 [Suillus placidus]|uniref:Uncharacterized protein n=1 Tax=Suillus placidus TaxID=48579 RepID=A0A9P6ZKY6_9AGAM|nr:hypothetical protein EV702DRAFT_1049468 [Suillus placidus]KAG1770158.1 hypothetical protein EV702DRAFT_1049477 [Suillus placidus]
MASTGWDEGLCDVSVAGQQRQTDVRSAVTSQKRVPRKLLDLEEDNDGLPMLSDTLGLKCGEQQHVIRLFLTKYYRMCMGTEKVKAAVPWGDLIKNQSNFFDGAYWLADVQVVEPSKMDKAGATALLDFWYDHQQKKLPPTFCFKAWKDTDGKMEPPAKAYQKVIRWLSSRRRNKAHNAPKATKASKHVLKHLQDSEESLDDREEYESSDDREEAISSMSKVREQPPPASIIHSSTTSAAVARPTKARVTVNKPPAPQTVNKPPASKAAKAKKEPALIQTTRSGKRRTAPPISDMPAKRTRSKVAIVEPPKPRRGRK